MKKIKWLLTIPAFTAPTTLVLCQCSSKVEEGVIIDTSVSTKVDMDLSKDAQGNLVADIQLKSELVALNKITSVKVTFNGADLVKDEDYSVEIETNEEGHAKVLIFGKTLATKHGKYVICPVIEAKEFTGITADVERKQYCIDDTVTKDNITIYKSMEGTQGDKIPWSTDIKVYDNTTLLTDFLTNGVKLTQAGTKVLTIKYGEFTTDARITVSKKQFKITCTIDSDECATLSRDSFYAYDGDVWGTINKPAPSAKADVYVSSLDWTWVDSNDDEIPYSTVISSNMSAKMKISLPTTTTTQTVDCNTVSPNLIATSYIPAECLEGTTEKPMNLATDIEYTFKITVPADKTIEYFWFYNCEQYKEGELMYLYKRNIVSITDGTNPIDYSIKDNTTGGGSYIQFNTPQAANTTINVKFRMLRGISCIPAFETPTA